MKAPVLISVATALALTAGCSPDVPAPVTVALNDSPAATELAARLPLTVELRDTWGQAMTWRLSKPITTDGATTVSRPQKGGIYYWPENATLAIYYDDLGQSVPPPGLIPLGTADMAGIPTADCTVTLRIDIS